MAKLTFKKVKKESGLRGICQSNRTEIKRRGRIVGELVEQLPGDSTRYWVIRVMLKSEEEACGWRWAQLKRRAESEEAAREIAQAFNERNAEYIFELGL